MLIFIGLQSVINSGLIIQWGEVITNIGITELTMPIAVKSFFISVAEAKDFGDYTICDVTSGGQTYTTYVLLAAHAGSSYSIKVHWHAICV